MTFPSPLTYVAAMTLGAIFAGCALTQGQVATIEAVDAAACTALSAIPGAGALALACPGEEALLAGVLAADVAAHPTATAPTATAKAAPVTRRTRRGRVLVGVVPAARAPSCQAALDAQAADGGAEAGSL